MMKLLTILFLLAAGQRGFAASYYFSSSGNNSAAGTIGAPWQTLNKLNSINLAPGDFVYFKSGETIAGEANIIGSGVNDLPITFTTYNGTLPAILSGYSDLSSTGSWTNITTNIWQANVNSGLNLDLVAIGTTPIMPGRTPNTGAYFTVNTHVNYTGGDFFTGYTGQTITSTDIPVGNQNWLSAEMVIRLNDYNLDRVPIISHSGNTAGYATTNGHPAEDNWKFFMQKHPATLDVQNEWFYNSSAQTLRVYSTSNPGGLGLKAATSNFAFSIVGNSGTHKTDYVFRNLSFTGQDSASIFGQYVDRIKIVSCKFEMVGYSSILVNDGLGRYPSSNIIVDSCNINKSMNCGIDIRHCPAITVTNSTINNSGIWEGLGGSNNQQHDGICVENVGNTTDLLISRNYVYNSGYCGIRWQGGRAIISYNYVDGHGQMLTDGGGIYTNYDNETSAFQRQVVHNVVLNGVGDKRSEPTGTANGGMPGIYNDDITQYVDVKYNTVVANSRAGIYLHNPGSQIVQYNNVFNNRDEAALQLHQDGIGTSQGFFTSNMNVSSNNLYTGNNVSSYLGFVSYALFLESNTNNQGTWGSFNNNFYMKPNNTNFVGADANYSSRTTWTARYGYDAASTFRQVNADSMKIFYNTSQTAQLVPFAGKTYRSMDGINNYTDGILLQPMDGFMGTQVTYVAQAVIPAAVNDRIFLYNTDHRKYPKQLK